MALIPDGTYKIRSVAYKDYVADLINGVRDGPIQGYMDRRSNTNDKWNLVNIGSGGNQITLESVSVPGYFANAQSVAGADLVSGTDKMVWNVVKVDRGYALEAPDYYHVLELLAGADYAPIQLVEPTGQDNTKWCFEPVSTMRQKKRMH